MVYKKILILLALVAIFGACKKETISVIGNDILPNGDKFTVNYFEFNKTNAVTVEGKKFVSNNRDIALLGSYTLDDKFGTTTADFITQVRLASLNTNFYDSLVVDSVKLFLSLNDDKFYGEENTEFHFSIFELNTDIYFDSTYYTNFDATTVIDNKICDTTFTPNTDDKILTFSLDNSYGEKVINADTTSTNEDFIKLIQGLYIKTDSILVGGSVLYIDYKSANSFIKIYYRDKPNSNGFVSNEIDLVLNNNCAEINMFKHIYGDIQFNDTLEYIYTQGMAGPMGKLDISDVKVFSDSGKIVINKAELVVYNENDMVYESPEKMFIEVIDPTEETSLVKTGYLNDDKTEYSFIITNHVTSIIDGIESKTGIYLYPAEPTVNASKTKLINNFNSKNIKLKLTYTKY